VLLVYVVVLLPVRPGGGSKLIGVASVKFVR